MGELINVDFSRRPSMIKKAVDKILTEHVVILDSNKPKVWENAQDEKEAALRDLNRRENLEAHRQAAAKILLDQQIRYQETEGQ
jgi:hypothetical protein